MNQNQDALQRGAVYESAGSDSFYKLMHLSGVPKEFWDVKTDQVAFQSYEATRTWKKDPDLFLFTVADQLTVLNGMLSAIKGDADKDFSYFAGTTTMVTSMPSTKMALRIASLIVRRLVKRQPHSKICWVNSNELTKWGKPFGVDWDAPPPDLVVITGLRKDPTKESYETVDRFRDWGERFAPVICVGTGADPVTLALETYNFTPNVCFFGRSYGNVIQAG